MRFYLGTPGNQAQAQVVIDAEMPVLVSFGAASPWIYRNCIFAFTNGLLIDSGAYSELTGAAKVDLGAYRDHVQQYGDIADACAGLDDISGDWRRSMENYTAIEETFPTFHDSDPPELLSELIAMATERCGWLGLGLLPPRTGKRRWLKETLNMIPDHIHVHGWALGAYRQLPGIDSVDSTNWFRDALDLQAMPLLRHLTTVEALRIVVERYRRMPQAEPLPLGDLPLFAESSIRALPDVEVGK
jgi:hypothetical protein